MVSGFNDHWNLPTGGGRYGEAFGSFLPFPTLLRSAFHNGNNSKDSAPPPDADEIFKKMKEIRLIPNAVAMLDGLYKDSLVQEAIKLFGLMRQKRSMPKVVIYT